MSKITTAANGSEDRSIPVWLQATEAFYKKLNQVASECKMTRYETLNRGLDALLQEVRKQQSPLNKAIEVEGQADSFRKTMGEVSRKYWASLSSDQKRLRAQKTAKARWQKKESGDES